MASRPSAEFEFRADDVAGRGRVLDHMVRLGTAHHGWVNLQPGVREEDVPETGVITGLIGGAGPDVPVCTWVAGRSARHGPEPDSLGLQHATGPKVVGRLASLGCPLPAGWRWVQDHPRRGLVVRPPPATPPGDMLDWLLRAGTLVSTVPLTGEWLASVYEGR